MQITAYSLLHFLTDGICAFAMFSAFRASEHWALYILIYNFCAFALQLPIGAALDLLQKEKKAGKFRRIDLTGGCAGIGVILTILGAFLHPALLGVGNALFHVGGGVGTFEEDRKKNKKGVLLGIFVAPGAIGLYLGTCLGKMLSGGVGTGVRWIFSAAYGMTLLFFVLVKKRRKERAVSGDTERKNEEGLLQEKATPSVNGQPGAAIVRPLTKGTILAVVLCTLVVVLRSYVGFAVSFSWKQGFFAGLVCTLSLALGKTAGGLLSARFGMAKVMAGSLVLAAIGYYFSDVPLCGILALFFFNMTMPVTLYLIMDRLEGLPGFSFGLLTLALFIGFLPVYLGLFLPLSGNMTGASGSLISLAFLLVSVYLIRDRGIREA